MFSSKTKDEASFDTQSTPVPTPAATPAPAAAAAPAPRPMPKRGTTPNNGAPSLISSDLTVTGTLSSAGDIQVDGTIEGDIRCANLVIGEGATVKGEVVAEEVIVRGRVEGSVRARKVQLSATCRVEGNILHEVFAVESGAFFEGNCRHSDNPLSDDAASPKAAEFKRKSSAPVVPPMESPAQRPAAN